MYARARILGRTNTRPRAEESSPLGFSACTLEHDILRLNVAVHHTEAMAVFDSGEKVAAHDLRYRLAQSYDRSTLAQLHD